MSCILYEKHHNIIDGIYLERNPLTWNDIPRIDFIDAEDSEGELYALFQDVKIYDIENIENFDNPRDKHGIKETIFIIRKNGEYYLCETQGEDYIKFAINISEVDFIKLYNRMEKIIKLQGKTLDGNIKPLF